ncbi:MAG TPA: hypothetical protein EYP49_05995 [Anaerolineae bacterium]|nr:hypothetical protein [Anaerolineae bacterium]
MDGLLDVLDGLVEELGPPLAGGLQGGQFTITVGGVVEGATLAWTARRVPVSNSSTRSSTGWGACNCTRVAAPQPKPASSPIRM